MKIRAGYPTLMTAIAALVFAGALFAPAPAFAQFTPTGRGTLRGLPGVEVIVEPIDPALEREGLTTASLQAAVAGQLRASGIIIYASQNENASAAKPYLYVNVLPLQVGRQGTAISIAVEVRQTLRSSVTNASIVNAMTWDQKSLIFSPPGTAARSVRGEAQSLVEQFVNDWRAVH